MKHTHCIDAKHDVFYMCKHLKDASVKQLNINLKLNVNKPLWKYNIFIIIIT